MSTREELISRPDKLIIAHLADCHLRATQYGSKERGTYFYKGLVSAINKAYEFGAQIILCAGDLLDSNNPGPGVVMFQLRQVDALLKSLNMPMLTIQGNHDNVTPSWLYQFEDPENTGIRPGICPIGNDPGGFVSYYSEGNPPLRIEGYHFADNDQFREIINSRPAHMQPCPEILMWHGELKEFCGYPKEEAISIREFPNNSWKLVAMGDQHIHKHIVRDTDGMVISYPGSTEMCSESEEAEKSMKFYEWSSDGNQWHLDKIYSVPFKTQKVLRTAITTQEELLEILNTLSTEKDPVLAYVRYDKHIPDIVGQLTDAAKTGSHILRLTPMMPDRPDMNALSRESVIKGPSEFFEEHSEDLIGDLETRSRISGLCKGMLDPRTDHRDILNKYCEERINIITT